MFQWRFTRNFFYLWDRNFWKHSAWNCN